jgi:hypothetical protein
MEVDPFVSFVPPTEAPVAEENDDDDDERIDAGVTGVVQVSIFIR